MQMGNPRQFYAQAVSTNSGDYTQEVYAFTGEHATRRWSGVKGRSNTKGEYSSDDIWPKAPTRTGLSSYLHMVDVDIAKDTISRRLAAEEGLPGRLH